MLNAGSESFSPGFLGSETRGKTLGKGSSGAAIRDFIESKDPIEKAIPIALDGVRDARNFDEVDASAHQHEATVAQEETFSPPGMNIRRDRSARTIRCRRCENN